jgi:hypothetical protein
MPDSFLQIRFHIEDHVRRVSVSAIGWQPNAGGAGDAPVEES